MFAIRSFMHQSIPQEGKTSIQFSATIKILLNQNPKKKILYNHTSKMEHDGDVY
ncbi:hypothetical protein HanIR_Chr13g0619771 [Helianthus annuus]|nr:hypothetical protein HanIR_Chr13g0619771 [Helianthus annuus]